MVDLRIDKDAAKRLIARLLRENKMLPADANNSASRICDAIQASMPTAATNERIVCIFIGNFKVGDNLVRNADALCKMSKLNENGVFNKLMVVQAGSIVETALGEIIYRAQNFTKEDVPNISKEDQTEIVNKTVELFNTIIQVMEKYKILEGLGDGIYDELHKLRKYRNKVHIQTDVGIKDVSRDENVAFSSDIVVWALEFTVRVLKHLNEKFPRPKALEQFAHELSIPTI
jgi:hypothetical protein